MERTNFSWLFSGILLLLILEPAIQTWRPEFAAVLEGVLTSLLLVGIWSLRPIRGSFLLALGLAAVHLVSLTLFLSGGSWAWNLVSDLSLLAFCVLSAVLAIRSVLSHGNIDVNHLMGALSVYLLLGVIWVILFEILRTFDSSALGNVAAAPGQPGATGELLYFSYVTLTTLGYGDVTPASPLARSLAMLEAVTGQLFLAVLVANLVGRIVARPSDRMTAPGRSAGS